MLGEKKIKSSNNFSSGLVHNNSNKKKNKISVIPNSEQQANYNEILSTDFNNSSITSFEEKVLKTNPLSNHSSSTTGLNSNSNSNNNSNNKNNSISNEEIKSTKKLTSLKEQIEELNANQTEMGEQIEEIKGDVSEIKNTLKNISSANYSTSAYKNNSVDSEIAGLSSSNSSGTFILESNETIANKETNSNTTPTLKANISNSKEIEKEKTTTKTSLKKQPARKSTSKKENSNIDKQQNEAPNTPSASINNNSETTTTTTTTNNNNNNNSGADGASGGRDFSEVISKITKGEIAAATKTLNTKLKTSKDPSEISECFYWLGECSFKQKDYTKAIANYKASIKGSIDKKDLAQAKIAEAYMRAGKNAEAKAAYQTLLDNYPRSSFSSKAKKMLQQL